MGSVIAHHIVSPLGHNSEENYLAVKAGKAGISPYSSGTLQMPEAFMASILLEKNKLWETENSLLENDFERMAFYSASHALHEANEKQKDENIANLRTVFILSSTKGDVEGMTPLADSAQRISSSLGIEVPPIVVCNACVSGLSALILADRMLAQGKYDRAVVCGCDVPRRFIISGFNSLKALSSEPCRPFDMERYGLNLGEAAATIVLGREPQQQKGCAGNVLWKIGKGFIKNDAYHISAPSKIADGLYSALTKTLKSFPVNKLAFINAHGTATLFNDQMESVAIQRAGLKDVPVNALKGYFGHTLGAAGILETIMCMMSIDHHTILGTKGFEELGVSGKLDIASQHRPTDKPAFVKMLSGFGGCNATLLATKEVSSSSSVAEIRYTKSHLVRITPEGAWIDGEALSWSATSVQSNILTAIYKNRVGNYPKFYKMDGLSRLGFVASELLLQAYGWPENKDCALSGPVDNKKLDTAIVLFNHSSSVDADRKYQATISDKDNYFPSPSVFVYTLPNIVTGEIAIRNQIYGETSFYILPNKNELLMNEILEASLMDGDTKRILTGWLNYDDDEHFEAELFMAEKQI